MTRPVGVNPFLEELATRGQSHGSSVALCEPTEELTYDQLCERIARAAETLRGAGVRAGHRVALVASNSNQYLISAFAVWELRAILVTVYPSSGHQDLSYCLHSSGAVLAVADAACLTTVTQAAPEGLVVIDLAEVAAPAGSPPARIISARPEASALPTGTDPDLSLICYTSGSTARPKAVMHTAAGLAAAARTYAQVWHLDHDDRTVVSLPMAWAFGLVTTSMATLVAGGTVLPLARSRPALLLDAVERGRATFLAGVTSMFAHLVQHISALPDHPDLSTLRLCISGGEPRNEAVFAKWSQISGRQVHDVYAASECFPVVTYDPEADPVPVFGSSGKVVAGAQMLVVSADGAAVPTGVPGEALWKGPALFAGYWGDIEQTRKAFTADGWYRTNDLVRVDQDGYVFVEGRLSDMIIRSGSNVSPAEVEMVLRAHDSVHAVAVVGLDDPMVGQRVVAVVVPSHADLLDADALRAHCARELANYKVPSDYIVTDELPVNTATGKIDRRGLAAGLNRQGAR